MTSNQIAFIAALLLTAGAASFALAVPERASADFDLCPEGDFCIWEHAGFKGGMYNSSRSDRDLSDNVFFKTRRRVVNQGSAIYNNGHEQKGPAGRDDVVIYLSVDDDVDRRFAAKFCLREGTMHANLANVRDALGVTRNDSIAGYRWATDRECKKAGPP